MFDYGFIGIQRDSRPVCSEKKGREKGIEERGRKGEGKEMTRKRGGRGIEGEGKGRRKLRQFMYCELHCYGIIYQT